MFRCFRDCSFPLGLPVFPRSAPGSITEAWLLKCARLRAPEISHPQDHRDQDEARRNDEVAEKPMRLSQI